MSTESQFNHANIFPHDRGATAAKCLGGAVYALFVKQPHDRKLWNQMATRPEPQPVQPPISDIAQEVKKFAIDRISGSRMSIRQMMRLAGTLIQFADINPALRPEPVTKWQHVESLFEEIVDQSTQAPLSFSQQLEVAHDQAKGDLTESLWRLFLTSRHMARWSDSSLIIDMPSFSDKEKVQFMQDWQESIAACKSAEDAAAQDTAGDAYYAWTHTLAKVAYGNSARPILGSAFGSTFHNGTTIMQRCINNNLNPCVPGGTVSDHMAAADYGNTMGAVLLR